MKQKQIIILRGVPGSGKSKFAEYLCQRVGVVMVCADDYFYDINGIYNFNPEKIGEAHEQCKKRFLLFMNEPSVDTIVVANTSTKLSDWTFYEECGKKVGAEIVFLVVENRHGNTNSHKVPEHVLEKHEQNIRNNLKLR